MSLLDIHQVTYQKDKTILENINYQIHPGDFVIILGVNGSGKSSLLKLLDRRALPTHGEIYLNKKPLPQFSGIEFTKKVRTLTQNCNESLFPSLTIFENYLLVKNHKVKNERVFFKNYIEKFNSNLSLQLDQRVEDLSGGEKQALALALSVLTPPQLLLLDEHTSALDPKSAKRLMKKTADVIAEHHITCILTTHDLNIAMEYGNRILALRQGKIFKTIDGDHKASFDQAQLLAACY
jgi:putative ABC transport system ATP-binding protein